jgi:hypothetical protein
MIRQLGSLWRSNHRPAVIAGGVTLGIAFVSSMTLLGWSNLQLRQAAMSLQAEQQAIADAALLNEELALLDTQLPGLEARSRQLRGSGFRENTDRVAWAESVAAVARELRPLSYSAEVGKPQWLPLPVAQAAWCHNLEAPSLHATDLLLRVQGLHEGELQRLLDTALATGGGVTRVEHCEMTRRSDDVGLDAECTLRRFGTLMPQWRIPRDPAAAARRNLLHAAGRVGGERRWEAVLHAGRAGAGDRGACRDAGHRVADRRCSCVLQLGRTGACWRGGEWQAAA